MTTLKLWSAVLSGLIFLALSVVRSEAETSGQKTEREREVDERIVVLEDEVERLGYRQKTGTSVLESLSGLELGAGLTMVNHATLNNDENSPSGGDTAETSLSGDLSILFPLGTYGLGLTRLLAGQGDGIAPHLPPTFSGPNADLEVNEDSFKLAEAWFGAELPYPSFRDKRVSFAVGKIDPAGFFDQNAVAGDETHSFLADLFVNNLSIDWGGDDNGYGLGTRFAYRFTSIFNKALSVEGQVGVFEGDGDFARPFDHPFLIGELDVSRSYYGLKGNYRFYVWTNQTDHQDFADVARTGRSNWGFGTSLDQQVMSGLALFLRYGRQDPRVGRSDQVVTVGGRLVGNAWNRGGDLLGLAAGYAHTSGDYSDAAPELDEGNPKGGEMYAEAYYTYKIQAVGGLNLSPDVQYVRDPGGDKAADDFYIFGLRLQLDI
ncbi:MAG: carbohydrate porin [Nitrospirae bacterium]|nr:carbohydrate porin [Nitrospirota bacterium]